MLRRSGNWEGAGVAFSGLITAGCAFARARGQAGIGRRLLPVAFPKGSLCHEADKATISGLTLPAGKQDAIFFDEELRGFGLRIRAGGKRTWITQYQLGGHQQRRVTIGRVELFSPEEARKIAREYLAEARLGQDPQRERETARAEARITLGAVAEKYLKVKRGELRPKSFRDLSRYLQSHWRPLHALPIHQVSRRDVAARLGELLPGSGPGAAVRARAALSALFAWAIAEGLTEHNPVIGTNQPAALRPRDRVLTDAELVAVWKACGEDDFGRMTRLLVLTACRRQEVGGMRWSELDPERGIWVIPGERTKNGREHTLPLPPLAWEIIEAVPHRAGIDLLFGRGGPQGYVGFDKVKKALDRRLTLPHWTLHDLRRSAATGMINLNIEPHHVEAVLNHYSGHRAGVSGVYNRSPYTAQIKAALAMWADDVRALVEGGERKIVQLPARA